MAIGLLELHGPMLDRYFKIGSPIERTLIEAWLSRLDDQDCPRLAAIDDGRRYHVFSDLPAVVPLTVLHPSRVDFLFGQVPVGTYRADLVLCRMVTGGPRADALVKLPPVAVECDGHRFHNKTPEQVAHDRRRDRFFAQQGFRILRFTGTEITHDAPRCAGEIDALFERLEDELAESEISQSQAHQGREALV